MKNFNKSIVYIITLSLLISCNSDESQDNTINASSEDTNDEVILFQYDDVKVVWKVPRLPKNSGHVINPKGSEYNKLKVFKDNDIIVDTAHHFSGSINPPIVLHNPASDAMIIGTSTVLNQPEFDFSAKFRVDLIHKDISTLIGEYNFVSLSRPSNKLVWEIPEIKMTDSGCIFIYLSRFESDDNHQNFYFLSNELIDEFIYSDGKWISDK